MNIVEVMQEEDRLAKSKMIRTEKYNGRQLALLTRENVAIAEAMVRSNSSYMFVSDKNADPEIYKSGKNKGKIKRDGSSAYWMNQLKNYPDKFNEIIGHVVDAVDRENSTHLNADGVGREEITKRIINIGYEKLRKYLIEPPRGNELIRIISEPTNGGNKKSRKNISFASKFCHYACMNLYEGQEYQDNFPIYDGVLKTVIPMYMQRYGYDKSGYRFDQEDQYDRFVVAIDELRSKATDEISRNGLDQLLWYFHKGIM